MTVMVMAKAAPNVLNLFVFLSMIELVILSNLQLS